MKRFGRYTLFILAFLGSLMLVVSFTPLVRWWAFRLASPWEDSRGDTLIVISGSTGGAGIIGYGTYLRCEYAVLAWREGGFRRVVVSGASPTGEPEAVIMKQFLVTAGVPESVVLVEPQATSTRENALFTKELLRGTSGTLVLLSSDYHIYRATRAFRKVGLKVLPRPVPDVSKRASNWWTRWPAFLDLLSETVKIVYYRLKDWI